MDTICFLQVPDDFEARYRRYREGLGDESPEIQPAEVVKSSAPTFSEKLPAGTEWKDFIFQFRDNENVIVRVRGITRELSYEEMGFRDKRKKEKYPPYNQQWQLFLALAKENGELDASSGLARDGFEKSKEALTEALKRYFSIGYDPFYPVNSTQNGKKRGSYKLFATVMWYTEEVDDDPEDPLAKDIRESYGRETPLMEE